MSDTLTLPETTRTAPVHALVWCEIPVTDLEAAAAYYGRVLGLPLEIDHSGPNPIAPLPCQPGGTAGHLYPGTPAGEGTGPTVHLHVDRIEVALERVMEAGGKVLPGIIPLPVGRFAYTMDPDGNSVGLFEMKPGA